MQQDPLAIEGGDIRSWAWSGAADRSPLPSGMRHLPDGACAVTAIASQIRDLAGRLSQRQGPSGRPAPSLVLDQG
jgi:hypothetical protein